MTLRTIYYIVGVIFYSEFHKNCSSSELNKDFCRELNMFPRYPVCCTVLNTDRADERNRNIEWKLGKKSKQKFLYQQLIPAVVVFS